MVVIYWVVGLGVKGFYIGIYVVFYFIFGGYILRFLVDV